MKDIPTLRYMVHNTRLTSKTTLFLQYAVLFFLVYWTSVGVSQYDALDLARNIENTEFYHDTYSVNEMILQLQGTKIDFIYFLINYLAIEYSIPLLLVTSITVFLYYILVISIMREVYNGRYSSFIILAILFTTPMTWVVAISRNLMGLMFLYASIKFIYRKKWIWATFFIIVSLLTHFGGVIIFLVLFIPAIILRNWRVEKPLLCLLLFFVTVLGFVLPNSFMKVLNFFLSDSGFSHYSNQQMVFFLTARGYGDTIPVVFAYIYSICLLLLNKKQGVAFWILFMLTFFLALSMNVEYNYIYRCMMCMPLFWGINAAAIMSFGSKKDKHSLYLLSLTALIPILLHLYAYRPIYFPSWR